ncbi:MAG: hypothetical protein KDH20_12270 [Rhodocyclaceae bacterium]|nr:hypothetical protein [Rhodocyclaceae bacterium]
MRMHLAAAALLGLAPCLAQADCFPISGTVQLTPDAQCQVASHFPTTAFTGECFSVTMSMLGIPTGRGHAGVTVEPALGSDGNVTTTPVVIPEDDAPVPRQIVQTARSAIGVGWGPFRTTLYSSDVMVIRPSFDASGAVAADSFISEQIVITGTDGRGLFANTTGHMVVIGNSFSQPARVVGELCRN